MHSCMFYTFNLVSTRLWYGGDVCGRGTAVVRNSTQVMDHSVSLCLFLFFIECTPVWVLLQRWVGGFVCSSPKKWYNHPIQDIHTAGVRPEASSSTDKLCGHERSRDTRRKSTVVRLCGHTKSNKRNAFENETQSSQQRTRQLER